MAVGRIDAVYAALGLVEVGAVARQHLDQPAVGQCVADQPGRLQDNAAALERRGQQHRGIVGAQIAADRHAVDRAVLAAEQPDVARLQVKAQAIVRTQIARPDDRPGTPEIVGAGAHHAPVRRELARDQLRVLQRPDAHGEIDALFDDIDRLVDEAEVDAETRVLAEECRQGRGDMPKAEADRRVDAQEPTRLNARRAEGVPRRLDLAEDVRGPIVEAAAGVGRMQAACRSLEQLRAEFLLEHRDLTRHGRWLDAQPARRGGKTAALDDAHESGQGSDQIHGWRSFAAVAKGLCEQGVFTPDMGRLM